MSADTATVGPQAAAAAATPSPHGSRGIRGGGGRRGGRAGGGMAAHAKGAVNAAAAQPGDSEETRKLRAKFANQLSMLRELFPSWSDEDLLLAVQDAGGDADTAAEHISQGHAKQFSSVKSKKTAKREEAATSTTTPATFQGQNATSGTTTGSAIAGGRGGRGAAARGGRGGAARGARGGSRGGAHAGRATTAAAANGAVADPSKEAAPATTSSGPTWADAVAATKSEQNGKAGATSWADDAEGIDGKSAGVAAPAAASSAATDGKAANSETEAPKQQGFIASAMQKILPTKMQPKDSKKSWAQIARPAEPAKTTGAASSTSAQGVDKQTISGPISTEKTAGATATGAGAVAAGAAAGHFAPSHESKDAAVAPTEAKTTAPDVLASQPEPAATTQVGAAHETTAEPTARPDPSTAVAGGRPAATRAGQSQRQMQRAKQDKPVVMRGSKAQYDDLDQRFGTLSFAGNDADASESAAVPAAAAVAAPQVHAAPNTATLSHETASAAPQGDARYGAGDNQASQGQPPVQQTQSDVFATQAPPQQQQAGLGSKDPYSQGQQYGYQQQQQQQQQPASVQQQHQQAHQAAVAQAQAAHNVHHGDQSGQYQQSTPSAYNSIAAQPQQQPQQAQQPQPQQQQQQSHYGDYSSMYGGLDSQRLSNYYGGYEQQAARGADDRTQQGQAAAQQQPSSVMGSTDPAAQHASGMTGQQAGAPQQPQQQQQQQQQQFHNVMPYYYPHYYLPNQFQHYGQPAAGYGQYALYGGQPQHPSKPSQPASVQSPYSQSGPHSTEATSSPYGSSTGVQGYGQSPASTALHSSYGDYNRGGGAAGVQNIGSNNNTDYSKLYGNSGASTGSNANTSSGIPGLGGFLGQSSVGSTGAAGQTKAQSGTLDNGYRAYDASKMGGTGTQQQRQGNGTTATAASQTPQQTPAHLQQQQGVQPGQAQQQPHQQQQPQQQPQQQYYQQYNTYAGHQPSNAGGYGNYPYRQYWAQ